MENKRKIGLLRFFAFIVGLIGGTESAYFLLFSRTGTGFFVFLISWVFYYTSLWTLIGKQWSDKVGQA